MTLSALIVDIWPQRTVATVFGLIAAGSGFGGLLSTDLVGRLITTHSYLPVFALMALLHPCALLLVRKDGSRQVAGSDSCTTGGARSSGCLPPVWRLSSSPRRLGQTGSSILRPSRVIGLRSLNCGTSLLSVLVSTGQRRISFWNQVEALLNLRLKETRGRGGCPSEYWRKFSTRYSATRRSLR